MLSSVPTAASACLAAGMGRFASSAIPEAGHLPFCRHAVATCLATLSCQCPASSDCLLILVILPFLEHAMQHLHLSVLLRHSKPLHTCTVI